MNVSPEQDIQRVLTGLRDATAPAGLEARIAQRMRHAANTPAPRTAPFTAILNAVKHPRVSPAMRIPYALAAAVLLMLTLATFYRQHTPAQQAAVPPANSVILSEAVESHRTARPKEPDTHLHPRIDRSFSAGNSSSCDCDESALAETLAPSHPAPPMPLTPQERRLVLAMRPGSAIEVAELDRLREPLLRATEAAREHAILRQYSHGLLSPLAAATALDPASTLQSDAPTAPEVPNSNQP